MGGGVWQAAATAAAEALAQAKHTLQETEEGRAAAAEQLSSAQRAMEETEGQREAAAAEAAALREALSAAEATAAAEAARREEAKAAAAEAVQALKLANTQLAALQVRSPLSLCARLIAGFILVRIVTAYEHTLRGSCSTGAC